MNLENLEITSDSALIHFEDDRHSFGWGTVHYSGRVETGQVPSIKVSVLLDDLNVPTNDLRQIALEKAHAMVKALASELEKRGIS